MTVRRLHVRELPVHGGLVVLDGGTSRHVRVLRLRPGDQVVLFDGRGSAAPARIRALGDLVTCEAEPPLATEPRCIRLVLMLAMPKGSKLEECVRMATELGADEIALMHTERTVPKWEEPQRMHSRLERLTRIAMEAAAQCERNDFPIIHVPLSPGQWLQRFPSEARGVLFGARAQGALHLEGAPEQLWCAVGPEGGFTDAELGAFQTAGFSTASLGRLILRVDTAVAAALALAQDRLQELLQAR